MTYETGYKKPPEHGKFKKGKSGNPKGRPKVRHSQRMGLDIQQSLFNVMSKLMTVTENGIKKNVTWLEALITRQASDALKGDKQSMKITMKTINDFCPHMVQPARENEELRHSMDDIIERVMAKSTGGLPPKRSE